MPSARIQRRIDALLDEADAAAGRNDWETVREKADAALAFDPENEDANGYLEAALRRLTGAPSPAAESPLLLGEGQGEGASQPTSFANGRYQVKRLLGEGGNKKVCLAHDSRLDRDLRFR